MKKWIWIGVVAVVVIFFYATYNGFVNKEEGLKTAWSNVETQYQRRADLIPNLVNTVKGYAAHESQTFEAVTEARAKATSINLSADDLTPEKLAEFQQAQAQVRSALGRLIAVSESYPDLKANQNFLELQAQLEGTENRISVARKEFNEVPRPTTSPCAASRPTWWPSCSGSGRSLTSRLPKAPKPHPGCSFSPAPGRKQRDGTRQRIPFLLCCRRLPTYGSRESGAGRGTG